MTTPPPPAGVKLPSQPPAESVPPLKRTALLVEAVSGALLLPGFGWMYAGNPLRGWVTLVFALLGTLPIVLQVAGLSFGLGVCCCLPPLYAGVAWDVHALHKWIDHPTPYTWRNVAFEVFISIFLLLLLIVIDIFLIAYLVNLLLEALPPLP